MNIPRKLKIGAIWWKVKICPTTEMDCESETYGDQNIASQTIRISDQLSEEMQWVVFLHEVLHCINSEMEHETVESLAQALYQVLSENKLLK